MINFLLGVLVGFAIAYFALRAFAARFVILSTVDILQKIANSKQAEDRIVSNSGIFTPYGLTFYKVRNDRD